MSGVGVWCLAALPPSGVGWCGRLAVAIGPSCVAAGLVLAKCLLCLITSSCQIYDWSLNTSRHHAALPIKLFTASCFTAASADKTSLSTFSATTIIMNCLKHLQNIQEDVKIIEVSMRFISAARFWWRRRGQLWRGSDIKKSSQELFYFVQHLAGHIVCYLVLGCGLQCACVMIIGNTMLGLMLLFVCLHYSALFCCYIARLPWICCRAHWLTVLCQFVIAP